MGIFVILVLARGIRVMNEQHQTWTVAGRSPLQRLLVTIRVTECRKWTASDELIDRNHFSFSVVDGGGPPFQLEHGFAVLARFEVCRSYRANYLSGWNAERFFRKRTDELDAAA